MITKKNEILKKLNPIFQDIFDNENIQIMFSTSAKNIKEWDSLSHIRLIVEIEKKLKIKFNSSEINQTKNVGEFIDLILNKNGKKK